ncbi:MAG: HNH endonuclease [Candidatus Kaiserbacteria bacterium]|nr:HNH endonuclease [Candidatus Kaiserbacteria bacterium]
MKFELKKYNRSTPKDYRNVTSNDLIADLRDVANKLQKKSVPHTDYDQHGKFRSNIFSKRFGGWNNALEMSGLQVNKNYLISEDGLFQNLEEVWTKLGRQPTYKEMQKPLSKYGPKPYERRFSTWQKALEKFAAYINNEENISLKEIENLETESNQHKTKRDINLRLRFIVMKRDDFKCKNCGRSPATDPGIILHIDHIKAWANGGETILENLQTLCSICNIGKSDLE